MLRCGQQLVYNISGINRRCYLYLKITYCIQCRVLLFNDFCRLPTDVVLREEWVSIIRLSRQDNNWQASKFCVVCSLHFKEDDLYFTEKGRRLIKKTSKPTINLSSSEISGITKSLMNPVPLEGQSDSSKSLQVNKISEAFIQDNSLEPEVRDSDLESIFDTPKKSQLRKHLKKHKLLRVTTKRKLRMLQQKIRRLEKRNTSLKNILKDLKDKNFINCDTHNLLNENIVATEVFHNLYLRSSGKKKIKYSPAIRKFSLSLNFYSPKGYDYVRKTFNCCLPHPKTLAKRYTHVKSEPGFTQQEISAK